jgi:hypothetical protein
MRYFVPRLQLGLLLPKQTRLEDKFGGVPWGLPRERWPNCRHCGKPQTLIAQVQHHPEWLDLGGPGRALYLFQCDGWWQSGCDTFSAVSGTNSCFILEGQELTNELTQPPSEVSHYPEARVLTWEENDDGISLESVPSFYDPTKIGLTTNLNLKLNWYGIRAGSVPQWPQGPQHCDLPGGFSNWRFLFQVSDQLDLPGPPPDPELLGSSLVEYRIISEDGSLRQIETNAIEPTWRNPEAPETIWHHPESGSWGYMVANLGMGTGHVFLSQNPTELVGAFSWQR